MFLPPRPLAGEGRGEGVCKMQYFFKHCLRLKQHIVVPESQRLKPKIRHMARSFFIKYHRISFAMLTAIKLNNQSGLDTSEVREVGANGMLAAKFETTDLPASEF